MAEIIMVSWFVRFSNIFSEMAIVVTQIHPLAVVCPHANIGHSVTIGPFSVVEAGTEIGDGCQLASHVTVKTGTKLGRDNQVSEGAVLGGLPQHLKATEESGQLTIGDRNIIREFATIHRGLTVGDHTWVGHDNMIMVSVHIGHDSRIGNHTLLVNSVTIGGHVCIDDRAYVSGASAIHQFVRVGTCAMVGGMTRLTRDVLPYVTVDGACAKVVGLNLIGLRRNGFSREQIADIKEAYKIIYRRDLRWEDIVPQLKSRFPTGPVTAMTDLFQSTQRGITPERREKGKATLKLIPAEMSQLHRGTPRKAA